MLIVSLLLQGWWSKVDCVTLSQFLNDKWFPYASNHHWPKVKQSSPTSIDVLSPVFFFSSFPGFLLVSAISIAHGNRLLLFLRLPRNWFVNRKPSRSVSLLDKRKFDKWPFFLRIAKKKKKKEKEKNSPLSEAGSRWLNVILLQVVPNYLSPLSACHSHRWCNGIPVSQV